MTRLLTTVGILAAAFIVPTFVMAASADSLSTPHHLPGTIIDTGTDFTVTDSAYRNVSLVSSAPIQVFFQSVPEKITLHVAISATTTATTTTTHLTLSGLEPNAIYHKYTDRYQNHEVVTADSSGSYIFDQEVGSPHLIWFQPKKSTKFIFDDPNGGDCSSIGVWEEASKTCTLTTDVSETTEIDGSGITLDGAGHTITGSGTGSGVYVSGQQNVTIKNLSISNFSDGIQIYNSQNVEIRNATISVSGNSGISIFESLGTRLIGNHITATGDRVTGILLLQFSNAPPFGNGGDIENNVISNAYVGFDISNQDGGVMQGNTVENAKYIGLTSSRMYNFVLRNNILSRGIYVSGTSDIDGSNTVNGKPIIVRYNQNGGVFDGATTPMGAFFCTNCTNVTLTHADISGVGYGAALFGQGNTVTDSKFVNTGTALLLGGGVNSKIQNTFFGSNNKDIEEDSSNNLLIEGNTFASTTGISLVVGLESVVVRKNDFHNIDAIALFNTGGSHFYNNNVDGSVRSFGAQIYLDNGLPDGGNYWAEKKGCEDINQNGICDISFSNSMGTDNYPWVKPNGWANTSINNPPIVSDLGQFKMFGVEGFKQNHVQKIYDGGFNVYRNNCGRILRLVTRENIGACIEDDRCYAEVGRYLELDNA